MAGHSQFKNIMFRKGKQDKERSKLFAKLGREITVASKSGLPDPALNARLRTAIIAAKAQYDGAVTMTDRMGALSALINTDTPERGACLVDFHTRFEGNHDVIDKWFTVQALAQRPDTLAQVEALLRHKDFTITNPNRLRSLVGAFAANQRQFHVAGGAGYRLLADQLLTVDRVNPQSAARLAVPLGRWRRFDAARGRLMQAQLERIVAAPGVSKDVLEMASRALA